jgi:hypothetical protein
MPSVPGDLFFFLAKRAIFFSREYIGELRLGKGLEQFLTPSKNSVPTSMSAEA